MKDTNKPILAICYDFDKTLSPNDMQAQGYIQSLKEDTDAFWKESNTLASDNDMDQNLAYMYLMVEKSKGKFYVTKNKLMEYGSQVKLFNGVEGWFKRINEYGNEKGVQVEHYIISSGLKEMIEGTVATITVNQERRFGPRKLLIIQIKRSSYLELKKEF